MSSQELDHKLLAMHGSERYVRPSSTLPKASNVRIFSKIVIPSVPQGL